MASFSHQQHNPFLHDSVFQTNNNIKNPIKMYGFVDNDDQGNINTNFFSQTNNYPYDQFFQKCHLDSKNSSLENSDNEFSDIKKQSVDSSSMGDMIESGEQVNSMDKKKKNRDGSSLNSTKFMERKEGKGKKQRKCNGEQSNLEKKRAISENIKSVDEAPLGYIHVRARRGQATDSHSLAERVRREKISQRMKLLQAIVPGCDKVTGKALMLEEIINYVQSLQHQVEFLSMKLASLNPMIYDFGVDPDALMMRSEKFNGLASSPPLIFVQQCSPTHHPNSFADSTNFNRPPTNHYSIVDPSVLVQHEQLLIPFNQDNGSQLWEFDGEKQKSGLFSNNDMCSIN